MRPSTAIILMSLWAVPLQAATLYVNNTGSSACSDATPKVRNSSASPWCTIGRAAWGATNRERPFRAEAAAAGDTVIVTGGTYDASTAVKNRFSPLYDPANSGTSSEVITFTTDGRVTITCANCESPVLGSTKNYVRFTAGTITSDRTTSDGWVIVACGEDPDGIDDCPSSGVATTHPDTGPVFGGATGVVIEGMILTGYGPVSYDARMPDNWPAIRLEGCNKCVVRNNSIRLFTYTNGDVHATCGQAYNTTASVIEHNDCADSGGFWTFKDNDRHVLSGNIVRFNRVRSVNECFGYSLQGRGSEDRNYVYQNVFVGCGVGANISGSRNDWFFNNTIVGAGMAAVIIGGGSPNVSGFRFWNNIATSTLHAIYAEDLMPPPAVVSSQHNFYQHTGDFFNSEVETDRATLAAFVDAHSNQETEAPASVVQGRASLYANPSGGDYRLCTGPRAPHVTCSGASPALRLGVDLYDLDGDGNSTETIPAGAYITGREVIGIDAAANPGG